MFEFSKVAAAVGGVAEVDGLASSGGSIQVSCKNITGDGTITLTGKPGNDKVYRSIESGADAIDLTDPIAVVIDGRFAAIKATSSNSEDEFELEVLS